MRIKKLLPFAFFMFGLIMLWAQVQPEGAQNSDQRKSLTDTKGSGGLIH